MPAVAVVSIELVRCSGTAREADIKIEVPVGVEIAPRRGPGVGHIADPEAGRNVGEDAAIVCDRVDLRRRP